MNPFHYEVATETQDAVRAVAAHPGARFLAGGTTVVDLMKLDVLTPDTLIGTNHLALAEIDVTGEFVRIGANVRNSQLARHSVIRERYIVLSEALLAESRNEAARTSGPTGRAGEINLTRGGGTRLISTLAFPHVFVNHNRIISALITHAQPTRRVALTTQGSTGRS